MTRQSLERGDLLGFLAVAVLPNLFWIVIPLAVIISLGRRVLRVGQIIDVRTPPSARSAAPFVAEESGLAR